MYDYEEACPVSKASSVLCERWTLQIIREMLLGASRFNELQTLLPRMSPTLLNARLKALEQQDIIWRRRIPEKRGFEYQLTPCGQALRPVIAEFGKWGMKWVFTQMNPEQLNVSSIVRDFAVALRMDQLPAGNLTLQFTITGDSRPARKFILVRDRHPQVCEDNIGNEVDVYLTASLETLGQVWYGFTKVEAALASGAMKIAGDPALVSTVSRWLGTSQYSACER
jgi:DNA-binding HxlR family transcriptional regulator